MTQTLTISESVLKPGIGYVPFKSDAVTFEDTLAAQEAFEAARTLWGGGESELLEMDGSTVEFQVGGWRRVMVDLA